jgi:S-adenosylmethionine hydrolase
MDNPNIVIVSDYGTGDPAFTEVMLQLKKRIPQAYLLPQSVPSFSTINTGYWIYQFAMNGDLKNTYIYSNTAPRKEEKEAQKNNRGEKLMYAKLKNGFEIVAVNAGYVFSFVKPEIQEFCYANIPNEGSQFRSRDIYPEAVAKVIQKDASIFGEKGDIASIPDFPTDRIASVDGYGNIKLTTRRSEVTYSAGQRLVVEIGNVKHQATFTDGSFNIEEGQVAFSPGSTGHNDKFMEIFYRGQSACELFMHPKVESVVKITPQNA